MNALADPPSSRHCRRLGVFWSPTIRPTAIWPSVTASMRFAGQLHQMRCAVKSQPYFQRREGIRGHDHLHPSLPPNKTLRRISKSTWPLISKTPIYGEGVSPGGNAVSTTANICTMVTGQGGRWTRPQLPSSPLVGKRSRSSLIFRMSLLSFPVFRPSFVPEACFLLVLPLVHAPAVLPTAAMAEVDQKLLKKVNSISHRLSQSSGMRDLITISRTVRDMTLWMDCLAGRSSGA